MIAIPNMEMPETCDMCPIEGCEYINGKFTCPLIEIVRCGECKYWDGIECQNDRASTDLEGGAEYALYRDDTDFCSYGERRADDKTEESRP